MVSNCATGAHEQDGGEGGEQPDAGQHTASEQQSESVITGDTCNPALAVVEKPVPAIAPFSRWECSCSATPEQLVGLEQFAQHMCKVTAAYGVAGEQQALVEAAVGSYIYGKQEIGAESFKTKDVRAAVMMATKLRRSSALDRLVKDAMVKLNTTGALHYCQH